MKPGWLTVHVPCESDPRLSAASIVMVLVAVVLVPLLELPSEERSSRWCGW